MKSSEITLRTIIGLATLTLSQTKNWLDKYDYKLRGSKIILLNNDREIPEAVSVGILTDVNEDDEIIFTVEGEKNTIRLGAKIVMIIIQGSIAKYVVCGV